MGRRESGRRIPPAAIIPSSTHSFPICHSFIPPDTHSFIPPLILSPLSSIHSPVHFHIRSISHSIIHSSLPPCIRSSTHSFLPEPSSIPSIIHSPLQPSVHSHLHSSIPPVIHSSAVSQCLFCAEPQARCWAPLINKVGPVPTPKTGIQFPGRGGLSDFFLPPFSNNFQKQM